MSHSWGNVTENTTEILTKVVVYNPNPVPIPIKGIEIGLYMNGIKMGEGENIGPAELKPNAETEIKLSTKIDNTKIPEWWVSHIKNGEKTEVSLKGKIIFDLKLFDFSWPFEERSVIKTDFTRGMGYVRMPVNIGPIKIYATMKSKLGRVDESKTEFIHEAVFTNPYAFPIPLTKIDYTIWINGIKIGEGSTEKAAIIPPKSDKEVNFSTWIYNQKLKEWWVSHIKNGETSTLKIKIMPTIEILGERFQFTLPEESTQIKTNILGET